MRIFSVEVLIFISFASFWAAGLKIVDRKQFIYLKAVQCKFNPKFLVNVSCFAKSYSRTVSKATVQGTLKVSLTSVLYKYGTIYRDVMSIPAKFDWCQMMNHIEEFREHPLANELIKVLDESAPGFVKPCPWKEIRLHNMTIETGSLISLWPSGDYKVIFYLFAGTGEDYINITMIGNFRTPLKETFG